MGVNTVYGELGGQLPTPKTYEARLAEQATALEECARLLESVEDERLRAQIQDLVDDTQRIGLGVLDEDDFNILTPKAGGSLEKRKLFIALCFELTRVYGCIGDFVRHEPDSPLRPVWKLLVDGVEPGKHSKVMELSSAAVTAPEFKLGKSRRADEIRNGNRTQIQDVRGYVGVRYEDEVPRIIDTSNSQLGSLAIAGS